MNIKKVMTRIFWVGFLASPVLYSFGSTAAAGLLLAAGLFIPPVLGLGYFLFAEKK